MIDWHFEFNEAKKNGGFIVSKVGPPSGAMCDHKESVWEYHRATLKKLMAKYRFRIAFESRNQVMIVPES